MEWKEAWRQRGLNLQWLHFGCDTPHFHSRLILMIYKAFRGTDALSLSLSHTHTHTHIRTHTHTRTTRARARAWPTTSPFHPRTLLQIYFPIPPPTSIPIRSLLSEIKPLYYTRLDSNNTMAHSHTTASHEYRSLWKARRTWPQKGNLGELNQAEAEKLICPLSFISSHGGHQHHDRTRCCEFGAPQSGFVSYVRHSLMR